MMMPMSPANLPITGQLLADVLEQAESLARAAGAMAMQRFGRAQRVDWKPDASPVTESDLLIEAWLRQELSARFPQHGILGEESGGAQADAEYLWILDPIDGTRSYARGIPIFGIQLALAWHGKPILGVIHLPALGETVAAASGLGCRFNGEPCRVSEIRDPARALVMVHERDLARARSPALQSWLEQIQIERNWGDCYSFVLVATGRAEVALDPRMQVWDNGPLPVILREAGGHFSDWQGADTIWTGSAVTANAYMAPALLELLQS
ncbi:MAG: histidinol phosphate phosphatase [Candidatus Melainabacteria bacterium HGW-Melainabacteria-1]|nr:MAG: histidinol phosphate phosphatase [Candidatus Melainabacteria bacterium HGW-Melainabacteria-1]